MRISSPAFMKKKEGQSVFLASAVFQVPLLRIVTMPEQHLLNSLTMQCKGGQCKVVAKSSRLLTNLGLNPGSATSQLCLCEQILYSILGGFI